MGQFKETFKRVRAESGLTLLKIMATALAAVTIAVISSRLTSVMNSLMLTFVISISSALINEFYRTVLTVGAEGTKAVVAPILGADGEHSHSATTATGTPAEAAAAGTSTTQTVVAAAPTETAVQPAATSVEAATESADVDAPSDVKDVAAPSDETPTAEENDAEARGEDGKKRPVLLTKHFWARLWDSVRHNQVVQMSILFAVVSLITLGISYSMAAGAGTTEITVNKTETTTESLTDEERQELLAEAIEASKQDGLVDGEDPSTMTPEELDTELLEDLSELRAENSQLNDAVASLQGTLQQQQAQIADLMARLEALESGGMQPDAFDTPTTPGD